MPTAVFQAIGLAVIEVGATFGIPAETSLQIAAIAISAAEAIGLQVGIAYLTTPHLSRRQEINSPQQDSYPPRRSGFGETRLSGYYMLFSTNGGGVSVDVLAIHDGEIDSFTGYYLFDDVVTLRSGNWVNELPGGAYRDDRVQFLTRTGLSTETAYSEIIAYSAGNWTSAHRGDGIASIGLWCNQASEKKQQERFPKGLPQPSVVAKLQKIYDPRSATTAWSDNPVLALMAYLTTAAGGMDLSYSQRIAPAVSDWEAAADTCEELVDLDAGGTEQRYRCGGVYNHTDAPSDVIGAILASCDGWLSQRGDGALVVKIGYSAPTITFSDPHIVGYSVNHYRPDEESVNELTVSFTDPNSKYATTDAGSWRNEAEITAQGRVRSQPLDLAWVPSGSQARRLAKIAMARLSAPLRGTVTMNLYGLNGLGERFIRLQISENDLLANLVVEITDVAMDLAAMQVTYTWVEANSAAYDWTTAEENPGSEVDLEPEVDALDAPTITSLTGFYETGPYGLTQPRLRVVTTTASVTYEVDWELQWQVDGASSWTPVVYVDPQAPPATLETAFVTADATINVQTRYRTASRVSDWSATSSIYLPAANPYAILDEDGAPILDEDGDQILDEDAP